MRSLAVTIVVAFLFAASPALAVPDLSALTPLELDGQAIPAQVPAEGKAWEDVREMAWGKGSQQVSFLLSAPARVTLRPQAEPAQAIEQPHGQHHHRRVPEVEGHDRAVHQHGGRPGAQPRQPAACGCLEAEHQPSVEHAEGEQRQGRRTAVAQARERLGPASLPSRQAKPSW